MAGELTEFLIALADRPLDAIEPRLSQAMAQAGLTDEQQRALRSRKPSEIGRLTEREAVAQAPAEATVPTAAKGELFVVGTGIKGTHDLSRESAALIRDADKVLYVVAEPAMARLIRQLNPTAENLAPLYSEERPRTATYQLMSERILAHVRKGHRVCAVFYGHPGVFVKPSHLAVRTARKEGYRAYMLPAVSALDCLFADLVVDPSTHSCLIFGATDLLVHRRPIDPTAAVVIYQAACVGDPGYHGGTFDQRHVPILSEYLQTFYAADHAVYIYEAAQLAVCNPRVEKTSVAGLPSVHLNGASTLYLPPARLADPDWSMVERLGLSQLYAGRRDR